jgi:signal transduction histidine kinase
MNIRSKILLYFSILSISIVGISFVIIYSLFSNYRTQEFLQRIKDKTITTVKFLVEIEQIDHNLLQTMDEYTINNLYKEKILIFDSSKKLIYSSVDDTKIKYESSILKNLSPSNNLIETTEDNFDVVGVCFQFGNENYYGISKAFDEFGLDKLSYLKSVFIIIFIVFSSVILITSYLLSKQITQPINLMAAELKKINLDSQNSLITVPKGKDEINMLATRFNELMKRLNDAFSFQKHAIHHISHELKTPIAVLVSNFEKMETEKNSDVLLSMIRNQKEDTKNLSDIINALLEISKVETGNKLETENVRIDELIFDVVDEIKRLHEDFTFEIELDESISSEESLVIKGNQKLLRLAIMNLATNCIRYSDDQKAKFLIFIKGGELNLNVLNSGKVIRDHEKQFLFQHFFRGENSKEQRGFGLGLVLISKIITLHHATISYSAANRLNTFTLSFSEH